MNEIRIIFRQFGTYAQLAKLINECTPNLAKPVRQDNVQFWVRANRIPAQYFVPIVNAATAKMIPLTERDLAMVSLQRILIEPTVLLHPLNQNSTFLRSDQ